MNKFGARHTHCGSGHVHDSIAEAVRCNELHVMQRAGEITGLRIQPKYVLIPPQKFPKGSGNKNELAVSYKADFEYFENGIQIVEEVKSEHTAKQKDYVIRRKLFKYHFCSGDRIIFREVVR